MNHSDLQSEIFKSGLIEHAPQDIADFKEQRKKENTKIYNKRYSQSKKKINLVFDLKSYEEIARLAKEEFQIPVATMLKLFIKGYQEGIYITPDTKKMATINQLLLDINNNISKSIALVPLSEGISYEDISALKRQIADIEFLVKQALQPKRLSLFIEENAERNPLFIPKLLSVISQYLTKSNHAD